MVCLLKLERTVSTLFRVLFRVVKGFRIRCLGFISGYLGFCRGPGMGRGGTLRALRPTRTEPLDCSGRACRFPPGLNRSHSASQASGTGFVLAVSRRDSDPGLPSRPGARTASACGARVGTRGMDPSMTKNSKTNAWPRLKRQGT